MSADPSSLISMGGFEALRAQFDPVNNKRKGTQFEIVCKWFLQNDPTYSALFTEVWLWDEWPGNWPHEAGIDLVAKDRHGKLWAIQSKAEKDQVTHDGVSHFLAESSRPQFTNLMLIATTDVIHYIGKRTLKETAKPVSIVRLCDLEAAELDWPDSLQDLRPAKPAPKEPWPYQDDAIDKVISGFKVSDRGQLIMACGTGKTLTALFIKERLAVHRTLFLVPSLSLLKQALKSWMANKTTDFDFLAVCSDETVAAVDTYDAALSDTTDIGIPPTTDPTEIADFMRQEGPQVIFATYQSSPQIADAFDHEHVPAFDLVIADEAHRCSGRADTCFTLVLDAERIKTRRRLFMTATPNRLTKRQKNKAMENDSEVASMDDEEKFGREFHRLGFGEAISKGYLTDYQVLVIGVDDSTYRDWADRGRLVTIDGKKAQDARSFAGQIGLAKAMRQNDLHRVVSFHNRVETARKFARSMEEVLPFLPEDERPLGNLRCEHVSGAMSAERRDKVLKRLGRTGGEDRRVVTNARCLGEGVDVPALDCVAFVEPRNSEVDIVQAVGRAIRLSSDKKLGTIVIPIFVDTDSDPEAVVKDSAFEPVWAVVRALRAHDEELAFTLDGLRYELGRVGGGGSVRRPPKIVLDLPTRISGEEFARAFYVRVIEKTTASWELFLGLLERFIEENRNCDIPQGSQTYGYPLGSWCMTQRNLFRAGQLLPHRREKLERLQPIWSWNPYDQDWEKGYRYLCQYVEEIGDALPAATYKTVDGYPLGQWVRVQRSAKKGNEPSLTPERQARLENVHPSWSWAPRRDVWHERYGLLQEFVREHRHAVVPIDYKTKNGFPLGRWVDRQRTEYRNYKRLNAERRSLLEAVHPTWTWNANETRLELEFRLWEEGFRKLDEFVAEFKTALVPPGYESPCGFNLSRWASEQRSAYRRKKLTEDQIARLEALPSWPWDLRDAQFQEGISHLRNFIECFGHACPTISETIDGFPIGRWVSNQRFQCKDPERRASLESVHPTWAWRLR